MSPVHDGADAHLVRINSALTAPIKPAARNKNILLHQTHIPPQAVRGSRTPQIGNRSQARIPKLFKSRADAHLLAVTNASDPARSAHAHACVPLPPPSATHPRLVRLPSAHRRSSPSQQSTTSVSNRRPRLNGPPASTCFIAATSHPIAPHPAPAFSHTSGRPEASSMLRIPLILKLTRIHQREPLCCGSARARTVFKAARFGRRPEWRTACSSAPLRGAYQPPLKPVLLRPCT
jgi:hypothetical protein